MHTLSRLKTLVHLRKNTSGKFHQGVFKTKNCSLTLSVKDLDTTGRKVVVYASAFGNIDSDRDIVMPGAFAKTIQENGPASSKPRIKNLWQHDSWSQIGKPLEMKEDSTGLLCVSEILKTEKGDEAMVLYQHDLLEHSIGYQVMKHYRDEGANVTQLTELKLYEWSAVTWGANPNTPLVGMKSIDGTALTPVQQAEQLSKRWNKIYKALRTGNLTDETCENLELEFKQIQSVYNDIIASLSAKQQPEKSTEREEDKPSEMEAAELLKRFTTSLTPYLK